MLFSYFALIHKRSYERTNIIALQRISAVNNCLVVALQKIQANQQFFPRNHFSNQREKISVCLYVTYTQVLAAAFSYSSSIKVAAKLIFLTASVKRTTRCQKRQCSWGGDRSQRKLIFADKSKERRNDRVSQNDKNPMLKRPILA